MWQFVWQAVKEQLATRDCLGNRHRVEHQPSSDHLHGVIWNLARGVQEEILVAIRFGRYHEEALQNQSTVWWEVLSHVDHM